MAKAKTKKFEVNENDDSVEVIKQTVEYLEKQHGAGILTSGFSQRKKYPIIPTGALTLDLALGAGGVPRGKITEIYGPEYSGKTTLTLSIAAQAQRMGGIVAFIDAEHALDPDWAGKIGVDVDKLLISQPDCGEQALEIVETLATTTRVDLIIIDSVPALVPKAELEGNYGDHHVGAQARMMSQALRKIVGIVSRSGTAVIFINQLREKIGVMFGNPETTSGGRALKFYSSVRLDIRKTATIKGTDGDPIASNCRVKVVKNRIGRPFKSAEFEINFNSGIDSASCLIDVATKDGINVMGKKGGYHYFDNTKIGNSKAEVVNLLKNDQDLYMRIEAEVYEKMNVEAEDNVSQEQSEFDGDSA